jgi:Sulfotransferase family
MAGRRRPNLFIIGAMKAGTTSLHECLSQHPDVFMTSFKEPQYFAPHRKRHHGQWGQGGNLPEPGADWYLRLFEKAGEARYAGESSTGYTKDPWVTGCADRIHEFNPEAKLIYIMRDPAGRTISHYWYRVMGREESRTPLEAIKQDEVYTAFSDCARQLRPYIERFGRSAVHVLTLEELAAQPAHTLDRLCEWLAIEPLGARMSFDSRNVGPSELRRVRPSMAFLRYWELHWRWQGFMRRHPGVASMVRRATTQPVIRDRSAERAVREYLRPIQQPQVRALSNLVGRDFPEWQTTSSSLHQDSTPHVAVAAAPARR